MRTMMRTGGNDVPYVGTTIVRAENPVMPDMTDYSERLKKVCGVDIDVAGVASGGPSVDVVIPHYGNTTDLDLCISAVGADRCVDEVLVIDNNDKNRGFTKAVNEGIRHFRDSENPYIAIVNNDTEIIEGGFAPLVVRMILSPTAGIVAPMAVLYDNPDQIQHAGGEQAFPNGIHRSGIRSLGQCNEPSKCKWLSFVVVLIRKDAIFDIGLLDEKMSLIGSDSDYCFRMRYSGWDCWYEPKSVWAHKCGESSGATSAESANVQRTDMFHWYRKWIKQGGLYTELANEVT